METSIDRFVELAEEIIQRLCECPDKAWWNDIRPLAKRLEIEREKIYPDFPACLLDETYEETDGLEAAQKYVAQPTDGRVVTGRGLLSTSDPMIGSVRRMCLWIRFQDKSVRYIDPQLSKENLVLALRRWLRFVEKGNGPDNSDSKDSSSRDSIPKKRERGRRQERDRDADQKVLNAWNSNRFKKYDDLAKELQMTTDNVRRAIDSQKKWLKKSRQDQ